MDCDGSTIDATYLDENSGSIRNAANTLCSLRGTQIINGESLWDNGFKTGVEYTLDFERRTITPDLAGWEAYWGGEGAEALPYSTNTNDNTTAESEIGRKWDTALKSDKPQELFLYAPAQQCRAGVSSVVLYFKDNSSVTLPVVAMDGVELGGSVDLTAGLIKASTQTDGSPVTSVTLGELKVDASAAGAVADGAVYNLQGIKVADSAAGLERLPKGIYVTSGKKVMVK